MGGLPLLMAVRRVQNLRRAALCVAFGLLVTVALAWAAMFWPRGGRDYYGPPSVEEIGLTRTSDASSIWTITEGRNAWHHVVTYWRMQISGMSLTIPLDDYRARETDVELLPDHLRPESVDDLTMLSWYREVGWPMPALTCSIHWVTQVRNADIIYAVHGGVQLPRDANFEPRALPLTPVWPGFAVDVALWSAVGFVLTGGCGALRRLRRRRRGQCLCCGYLLTGLPRGHACPECGRQPDGQPRRPEAT